MSIKYALIIVEGSHDQAFVSSILQKLFNLKEFNGNKEDLIQSKSLWRYFIPNYNPNRGKFHVRLNTPSIFNDKEVQDEFLSVAIYRIEGGDLSHRIDSLMRVLRNIDDDSELFAFGIVVDADKKSPETLLQNYSEELKEFFDNFPTQLGIITNDSPRLGMYVLPNNRDEGVLEKLLYQCGIVAYPKCIEKAENYVNSFTEEERWNLKIKWKPFDKDKAIIASVASVFKPGFTNTVSIKANKWISEETYNQVDDLKQFVDFLKDLLNKT